MEQNCQLTKRSLAGATPVIWSNAVRTRFKWIGSDIPKPRPEGWRLTLSVRHAHKLRGVRDKI